MNTLGWEELKRLSVGISLAASLLASALVIYAETRYESANRPGTPSQFDGNKQTGDKRNESLGFLTDVNVAVGLAGISGGDYDAVTTREVRFDVLKIRNWFAQFGIREKILFDPSPSQLDHELEYLGIGYETAKGRIRLFWDHTCHNPTRKLPAEKRNSIHWNELGIGYETMGMRLGHKNHRIIFDQGSEWLHNINWRASLSKIWMRTENRYEWIFKFDIRDDAFRVGNQVLFVQLGLESIYDDRGVNLNPRLAIGDRIHLNEHMYLIPSVSYEHFHDWYRLGDEQDFFSAGLSLEMALDHEILRNSSVLEKPKVSWVPRFHVNGGYAKILDDEEFGYRSDLGVDLDLLKINHNKTLSIDTHAGILTLPHDLNPYIVTYAIAPTLKIDLDNLNLKVFHSYSSLYGLEDEGVIRDYHLLGLELKDNNMAHWNWNLRSGGYVSTKDFDFWGDLRCGLIYNLRKKGTTPYVGGSVHYLLGGRSVFGHAIEAGVKIPGRIGSVGLYFRHQDDYEVFRFGRGNQTLLGFGVKI